MRRPSSSTPNTMRPMEFRDMNHMRSCFSNWGLYAGPSCPFSADRIGEFEIKLSFWTGKCGYAEAVIQYGFLVSFVPNRSMSANTLLKEIKGDVPENVKNRFIARMETNRRRIDATGVFPVGEGALGVAFIPDSPRRSKKMFYLRYDKVFHRFTK